MSDPAVLRTARLLLRPWRDEDLTPFAALNADPRVREHLPGPVTAADSAAAAARIRAGIAERGFGLWAVEIVGVAPFVGFVGLNVPDWAAPLSPPSPFTEIGWRLAHDAWGRGYATEAARAALAFAFDALALDEVVAFTVPRNVRSRRVMDRLGMRRDPAADFDHPRLPDGHPLRRHVLYRARRADAVQPGQIAVRPGASADAAALGAVQVRAWRAAYGSVMPDEYLDAMSADERAAAWRNALADPAIVRGDRLIAAAACGGVARGFAFAGGARGRDEAGWGELYALNVDPAAWGRGVGRGLLAAASTWLDARYAASVLWVVACNPRARALYERAGWTLDGARKTDTFGGAPVDLVRYRRPASH